MPVTALGPRVRYQSRAFADIRSRVESREKTRPPALGTFPIDF